MNIPTIKKELETHLGKRTVIKYNMGRNKYEKYKVVIRALYQNVFVVEEIKEEGNEIRCFSYSDIIMRNIRFYHEE